MTDTDAAITLFANFWINGLIILILHNNLIFELEMFSTIQKVLTFNKGFYYLQEY